MMIKLLETVPHVTFLLVKLKAVIMYNVKYANLIGVLGADIYDLNAFVKLIHNEK